MLRKNIPTVKYKKLMAKRRRIKIVKMESPISDKSTMELIYEKMLRSAKFEHTVEFLDLGFGENWKNFKKAWLNEEFFAE